MQIYNLENNDSRNVLSPCRLKLCEFVINYILKFSICSTLSTYQVFFKYYFNKSADGQLRMMDSLEPVDMKTVQSDVNSTKA